MKFKWVRYIKCVIRGKTEMNGCYHGWHTKIVPSISTFTSVGKSSDSPNAMIEGALTIMDSMDSPYNEMCFIVKLHT